MAAIIQWNEAVPYGNAPAADTLPSALKMTYSASAPIERLKPNLAKLDETEEPAKKTETVPTKKDEKKEGEESHESSEESGEISGEASGESSEESKEKADGAAKVQKKAMKVMPSASAPAFGERLPVAPFWTRNKLDAKHS